MNLLTIVTFIWVLLTLLVYDVDKLLCCLFVDEKVWYRHFHYLILYYILFLVTDLRHMHHSQDQNRIPYQIKPHHQQGKRESICSIE